MTDQNETIAVLNTKLGALHDDIGTIKFALTKLTDAINKLALIEQQQTHAAAAMERAFKHMEKIEARIDAVDDRILDVELQLPQINKTSNWVERAVIAIVGAAMMYLAKQAGVF